MKILGFSGFPFSNSPTFSTSPPPPCVFSQLFSIFQNGCGPPRGGREEEEVFPKNFIWNSCRFSFQRSNNRDMFWGGGGEGLIIYFIYSLQKKKSREKESFCRKIHWVVEKSWINNEREKGRRLVLSLIKSLTSVPRKTWNTNSREFSAWKGLVSSASWDYQAYLDDRIRLSVDLHFSN